MRKSVCLIVCLRVLLCGFLCGRAAVIAEEKIDFPITADYLGKYIWRGQNLSDDPVFQPGLSASYKGLTALIWGNLELTNINGNNGDFSELDYSLGYLGAVPGVVAYIQPHKLQDVEKALYKVGVYKMSVTNALGCGEQKGYHESYGRVDFEVNLLKKVRLEIAVNEEFVEKAVNAIIKGAKTGQIGDGKIFVLDLPECIRIRTGEKGKKAIG